MSFYKDDRGVQHRTIEVGEEVWFEDGARGTRGEGHFHRYTGIVKERQGDVIYVVFPKWGYESVTCIVARRSDWPEYEYFGDCLPKH